MPETAPTPDPARLRAIVEALAFAAEEPLTLEDLRDLFPAAPEETLREALERLARDCQEPHRGLQVMQVAGGWRMTTRTDCGEWVRALFRARHRRRLSGQALETLAIIAYRQPITTPEIQAIRGTDPGGVLEGLLEKKLVRILGRKKVVGKPILYGTTREFLTHFGLNSLEDLPSFEEFERMAGIATPAMRAEEDGGNA
jgi:segregation and condensation protein B